MPFATPGWGVLLVGVGAFGNIASIVMASTAAVSYRQAVCPPDLLNRVTAAMRWMSWCLLPLGSLLGGLAGSALGVRAAVAVAVTGGYLSVLWLVLSPLRTQREIPWPPASDRMAVKRVDDEPVLPTGRAG